MRIGIITAMAEETMPVYEKLGNLEAESFISGVRVCKFAIGEHLVYLATGGVGEIRAAMAVQLLKDLFDVEAVVNFGFAGALRPSLGVGELVLASRVCHYQFDTSLIDGAKRGQYDGKSDEYFYLNERFITLVLAATKRPLKRVSVASGDVFIGSDEQKKALRAMDCDICDMELAGLAIACERNSIPLLSVKVVSDSADGNAKDCFVQAVSKGLTKYEEIMPDILAAATDNVGTLPPVKNS